MQAQKILVNVCKHRKEVGHEPEHILSMQNFLLEQPLILHELVSLLPPLQADVERSLASPLPASPLVSILLKQICSQVEYHQKSLANRNTGDTWLSRGDAGSLLTTLWWLRQFSPCVSTELEL